MKDERGKGTKYKAPSKIRRLKDERGKRKKEKGEKCLPK